MSENTNETPDGAQEAVRRLREQLRESVASGRLYRGVYRAAQPSLERHRDMETSSKAASKSSRAL